MRGVGSRQSANFHVEVEQWTRTKQRKSSNDTWSAIVATTDQTRDILSDDAFLLALRLVVQEAYAAGKRDSEHTEQETEHGTR